MLRYVRFLIRKSYLQKKIFSKKIKKKSVRFRFSTRFLSWSEHTQERTVQNMSLPSHFRISSQWSIHKVGSGHNGELKVKNHVRIALIRRKCASVKNLATRTLHATVTVEPCNAYNHSFREKSKHEISKNSTAARNLVFYHSPNTQCRPCPFIKISLFSTLRTSIHTFPT